MSALQRRYPIILFSRYKNCVCIKMAYIIKIQFRARAPRRLSKRLCPRDAVETRWRRRRDAMETQKRRGGDAVETRSQLLTRRPPPGGARL